MFPRFEHVGHFNCSKNVLLARDSTYSFTFSIQRSAKAFHAFSHYRDLPVSSRSIDAAWAEHARECLGRQGGERRATGAFSRLSVANDWPARAADHDDDLSRRRRERRAAELERAQDDIAAVARSQLARVAERLRDMESDELGTNVLHSWLKAASEILLRVLGGDDKRVVEVQGEVGPSGLHPQPCRG